MITLRIDELRWICPHAISMVGQANDILHVQKRAEFSIGCPFKGNSPNKHLTQRATIWSCYFVPLEFWFTWFPKIGSMVEFPSFYGRFVPNDCLSAVDQNNTTTPSGPPNDRRWTDILVRLLGPDLYVLMGVAIIGVGYSFIQWIAFSIFAVLSSKVGVLVAPLLDGSESIYWLASIVEFCHSFVATGLVIFVFAKGFRPILSEFLKGSHVPLNPQDRVIDSRKWWWKATKSILQHLGAGFALYILLLALSIASHFVGNILFSYLTNQYGIAFLAVYIQVALHCIGTFLSVAVPFMAVYNLIRRKDL